MKKVIEKHWALIGFVAAFLLDSQFGFVEAVAPNETVTNLIHGLGAIVLAYFWQNENAPELRGIGGRPDDRNPKK